MSEESLSSVVAAVESAVKPLGFKISYARRQEKARPLFKEDSANAAADEEDLEIAIIRPGKFANKEIKWVPLGNPDTNEDGQ